MARGVRFLLGFRQYPFLKKTGPGIPVFGYCPWFYIGNRGTGYKKPRPTKLSANTLLIVSNSVGAKKGQRRKASRQELSEYVPFGIGTLLVVEQSSSGNRPRGV